MSMPLYGLDNMCEYVHLCLIILLKKFPSSQLCKRVIVRSTFLKLVGKKKHYYISTETASMTQYLAHGVNRGWGGGATKILKVRCSHITTFLVSTVGNLVMNIKF